MVIHMVHVHVGHPSLLPLPPTHLTPTPYSHLKLPPVKRIRDDMDEKEGSLFGAHGYCTQVRL